MACPLLRETSTCASVHTGRQDSELVEPDGAGTENLFLLPPTRQMANMPNIDETSQQGN